MDDIENTQRLIAKAAWIADGQPIKQIHVLHGDFTGIAPEQLQAAFDRERHGTLAAAATLRIVSESGRAVCQMCEAEWAVSTQGESCRTCGSSRTQMVAGHLLHLASLTFSGWKRDRPGDSISGKWASSARGAVASATVRSDGPKRDKASRLR